MSGSKEYILRKPIEIWQDEQGNYCAYLFDDLSDDPGYRTFDKEYLDDNFVVFDREQLKQQLIDYIEKSEILLALFLEGREPGKYHTASVDEATHEIAEMVMSLCFGEETE